MFFRDDLGEASIPITEGILKSSRIDRDYWKCELSKIPPKMPYLKQLQEYVSNIKERDKNGQGLYLFGSYGSGKSGAAVAIIKEAIRRGGRAMYVHALELESIFGKQNVIENGISLADAVVNVHFLIFDDLGAESKIPWATTWVEKIIKFRNNKKLPTIITSNETPVELFTRIKSIASILGGKYEDIRIDGIDWRLDPPK